MSHAPLHTDAGRHLVHSAETQQRFILDMHLGKLAFHLRMLGYDAVCDSALSDGELLSLAFREKRILLSRDRKLLGRAEGVPCLVLRSSDPREQLLEVLRRFGVERGLTPFSRCLRCNREVHPVEKSAVEDRLPPVVRRNFEEFTTCVTCGRVYWKGSHYERMSAFIDDVMREVASGST